MIEIFIDMVGVAEYQCSLFFSEVRSVSIDSICMLSVNEPNFAIVALDFLVDMFNDDIQEVRLKAIDSLCKMSDHIEFREDQLEIILGLLEVCFHSI